MISYIFSEDIFLFIYLFFWSISEVLVNLRLLHNSCVCLKLWPELVRVNEGQETQQLHSYMWAHILWHLDAYDSLEVAGTHDLCVQLTLRNFQNVS